MRQSLTILIFLILGNFVIGQNLQLTYNGKTKSFGIGEHLVFSTEQGHDGECSDCETHSYEGKIIDITKDSVQLEVFSYSHVTREKGLELVNEYYLPGAPGVTDRASIHKGDIYLITKYGSDKKENFRRTRSVIGGLLLGAGLATVATAFFVEDDSRTTLLRIGAGEAIGGLIIGISSTDKRYDTYNKWKVIR